MYRKNKERRFQISFEVFSAYLWPSYNGDLCKKQYYYNFNKSYLLIWLGNAQWDYSQNFIESYKLCFSLETGDQFDGDIDTIPDNPEDNFFSNNLNQFLIF